eukprot:gb/GFBE01016124.1/.p1 GENE.gb/GFBE01016124.1/~~gb/GFBE01016124.1/.p1  ORF type:complete len:201 (+),score=22.28 gb/GFBE01016124.1/:1-603(+)
MMCWNSGDQMGAESPPASHCIYKSVGWLMGAGGLGIGGEVIVLALFSFLFLLCLLKQCAQGGNFGPQSRAAALARREASEALQQRRAERSAARARMQELREQLAQIPLVPMGNQAPAQQAAATGAEAPHQDQPPAAQEAGCTSESSSNLCPICQSEVVVRVALQRCGHTACRDCTLRLVELAQPCHICRGPIEGVLPVYI